MTARSSKGVPASAAPRRSVFQRRTEGSVVPVTQSTSGAERSEAIVGLGRLFRKLLSEGEQAVQEQELSSQASHVPDPALVAAIERSLLREKARRV